MAQASLAPLLPASWLPKALAGGWPGLSQGAWPTA